MLEKQALHEVARLGGIVACGGGTPCIEGNMELMNEMGLTIWLTTSAERIAARLCLPEQKAKRPLIAEKTDEEILEFVKEKLAEREPFYSKAQLRFDSTNIETATDTLETANLLAGVLSTRLYCKDGTSESDILMVHATELCLDGIYRTGTVGRKTY